MLRKYEPYAFSEEEDAELRRIEKEKEEFDETFLRDKFEDDPEKPAEKSVVKVKKPDQEVTKAEWDSIVKKNFPTLWRASDITMSAVSQLLLKDAVNPLGVVLVDRPSSGKTIILNFFSDTEELVYTEDKFSPASFVSHAANRSRKELRYVDLLPKIKDKVLIVRDLAPIFSQRSDDLQVNMGVLTRVFDGEGLETSSGVHGQRGYKGTYVFVFLAASTPIPPQIWKTMSTLGSRLLFVNVGSKEKDEEELASQLSSKAYREKEKLCRKATSNFLRTLWRRHHRGIEWDHKNTDKEILHSIARMAKFLAKYRGSVVVWRDDGGEGSKLRHSIPLIEQPDRLNQILYNFARGNAVTRGRDHLKESDLKSVLQLVLESVPYDRSRLFKHLVNKDGILESTQVCVFLNCSKPKALNEMKILAALGVVRSNDSDLLADVKTEAFRFTIELIPEFKWLLELRDKWPRLFEL